jgi:hypothetical protein
VVEGIQQEILETPFERVMVPLDGRWITQIQCGHRPRTDGLPGRSCDIGNVDRHAIVSQLLAPEESREFAAQLVETLQCREAFFGVVEIASLDGQFQPSGCRRQRRLEIVRDDTRELVEPFVLAL